MIPTHKIISMEAAVTKTSQSKMWRCLCESGEKVNIFQHADPGKDSFHLFAEAGFEQDLAALETGMILTWKQHPIGVIMAKSGEWWNAVAVFPREEGQVPDPAFVPNIDLYRHAARKWAQYILQVRPKPAIIDTETTGTRPDDEIVQIAIVDADYHNADVCLKSLVKPTQPERMTMPIWGNNLTPLDKTGISPELLASAPPFPAVYPLLYENLAGRIWIAYNSDFDVRMLRQDCVRHNLPLIPALAVADAMKMFSMFYGEWDPRYQDFSSKKLELACAHLGVPLLHSHDAADDCLMLWNMIVKMGAS